MKLRIGIVGMGPTWSNRHRPALQTLAARFEVRAICDPVAHRASQVASEINARQVDGFRELIASEDVDAILFLSPRWYGALPIQAACEEGKAVYCGASVEMTADEALRLRDRIRESGIAFMAEFANRLAPATIRLQELMATRLGRPKLLFCNQRHTSRLNGGDRRGAHLRHLAEMVDWCRYLVGKEATSVVCAAHSSAGEQRDDYSLMMLDFSETGEVGQGPVAQIACGSYVPPTWLECTTFRRPADLQIVCEGGVAFVDLPNTLSWFDGAGQHAESLDSERPVGEQLLMHFHRSVSSLVLKTADIEDAYRALSIVIAAQQSAEQGRRVDCHWDPTAVR